jgi:hypothetical protein
MSPDDIMLGYILTKSTIIGYAQTMGFPCVQKDQGYSGIPMAC